MAIEKLIVKFYASRPVADLRQVIDVFHGWIQHQGVPGMLIDVADYAHVPEGPGIILIGHEADHAIDEAEGAQGYLYRRKRGLEGSDAERVATCIRAAAQAAAVFEQAGIGFEVDPKRLRLICNDRLHQPNDPETFRALEPAIAEAVQAVYGSDQAVIERDPRQRLTIHVAVETDVSLDRLAGSAAGAS